MKNKTPEFTVETTCVKKRTHRTFRDAIKAVIKQTKQNMRFLKMTTVNWNGRIIVSVNTEPGNVRMLPDLDEMIAAKRKS